MTKYVSEREINNRFGFHPATNQTRPLHEESREAFTDLAHWVNETLPEGREKSLCLTAIQEAAMWSNAAIACNLAPLEEKNEE